MDQKESKEQKESKLNFFASIASLITSILTILSALFSDKNQAGLTIVSIFIVCLILALLSFKKKQHLAFVSIAIALITFAILQVPPKNESNVDIPERISSVPTEIKMVVPTSTETVIPTESETVVLASTEIDTPTEFEAEPPLVLLGTTKKFGHYEQDDIELNGSEAIEWIALTQEEDKVLIISVSGLESLPYYKGEGTSDWKNSSIRAWLNGTFYQTAFSDEEKANIVEETIIQHKNRDFPDCEQGEDTTDNVFLLSLEEYTEYLYKGGNIDVKYRKGIPSIYVAGKLKGDITDNTFWWWLRTSSRYNTTACTVTGHGEIDYGNKSIHSTKGMVRPAMWVKADWWNELQ